MKSQSGRAGSVASVAGSVQKPICMRILGERAVGPPLEIAGQRPALPAENGRAGEIRTHDLLHPMQARYQATLQPEQKEGEQDPPAAVTQALFPPRVKHSKYRARCPQQVFRTLALTLAAWGQLPPADEKHERG